MFRFKFLSGSICICMFLLMMSGMAHAALTTIGTAAYNGNEYKLIWDDDNNGNSVVWLDYTNDKAAWADQVNWAAGLDSVLTINLYDGYAVDWQGSWRLPATVDGPYTGFGYDGTKTVGYNITSAELGHLFYEEFGNLGRFDTSRNMRSEYGLTETGDFENLLESRYWSGTKCEQLSFSGDRSWYLDMRYGLQHNNNPYDNYAMAVRSGQVSVSATPVPGTALLLGVGLVGLLAAGRRRCLMI